MEDVPRVGINNLDADIEPVSSAAPLSGFFFNNETFWQDKVCATRSFGGFQGLFLGRVQRAKNNFLQPRLKGSGKGNGRLFA